MISVALFWAQVSSYRALRAEDGGTFLLQFGAWEDVDLSEEILPQRQLCQSPGSDQRLPTLQIPKER